MSHGIQLFNASGQPRLLPKNYIHRFMGSGFLAVGQPYATYTVAWPGMAPTDEWFISLGGPAVYAPGTNQFTVKLYGWNYLLIPNIFYAVYRR